MNKKGTLLFLILIRIASFGICEESYAPLSPDEQLFKRDIPIIIGEEKLEKRLAELKQDHPIWALNLSGGSARALAHIGVLKRLEEDNIRPDVIITNSMGSIVGLMYAAGIPLDLIEQMFNEINLPSLFQMEVPLYGGILNPEPFMGLCREFIGDVDISDLPIPVMVVTDDIRSKRKVILAEGNFAEVMTAAFALPVYFIPRDIGPYRLIDGGISNIIPLAPFDGMIDVMVASSTFYNNPSLDLSNPLTILNVSMDIGKTRQAVNQMKARNPYLIRCQVEDISFMAFDKAPYIIDLGYKSCDESIGGLKNYLKKKGIPQREEPLKPIGTVERREWQNRFTRIKTAINTNTGFPTLEPRFTLSFPLKLWKTYRTPRRLNQANYIGLAGTFTAPYFEAELAGLLNSGKNFGPYGRMEIASGAPVSLTLENYWSFGTTEENPEQVKYKSNYLRLSLEGQWGFGANIISPFITAELEKIHTDTVENQIYQAGLVYSWESPGSEMMRLEETLCYFFRWDDLTTQTHGINHELFFIADFADYLRYRAQQSVRIPFAGEKRVTLTHNDSFRHSGLNPDSSSPTEDYPSFALFSQTISCRFGKIIPPLAELIDLKESELGVFCDFLLSDLGDYDQSEDLHATLGVDLRLSASLIGLQEFNVLFSTGWDFYTKKPMYVLNFRSVY